jgi:hypothetical protein
MCISHFNWHSSHNSLSETLVEKPGGSRAAQVVGAALEPPGFSPGVSQRELREECQLKHNCNLLDLLTRKHCIDHKMQFSPTGDLPEVVLVSNCQVTFFSEFPIMQENGTTTKS